MSAGWPRASSLPRSWARSLAPWPSRRFSTATPRRWSWESWGASVVAGRSSGLLPRRPDARPVPRGAGRGQSRRSRTARLPRRTRPAAQRRPRPCGLEPPGAVGTRFVGGCQVDRQVRAPACADLGAAVRRSGATRIRSLATVLARSAAQGAGVQSATDGRVDTRVEVAVAGPSCVVLQLECDEDAVGGSNFTSPVGTPEPPSSSSDSAARPLGRNRLNPATPAPAIRSAPADGPGARRPRADLSHPDATISRIGGQHRRTRSPGEMWRVGGWRGGACSALGRGPYSGCFHPDDFGFRPWSCAPFPAAPRRTVHAVLPHTAHRRRSPPAFGVTRQARKGLGAATVPSRPIRPR